MTERKKIMSNFVACGVVILIILVTIVGLGRTVQATSITLTIVASEGDTIGGKTLTGFSGNPSINNNGDVSFIGVFSSGRGIFTQNSLLAAIGDSIDGKTLTDITPGS